MATTKKYDLRDYSKLIHDCVNELNKKDENYSWSIKFVSEYRAQIFWSYLAGESRDTFSLKLMPCNPNTSDEWYITCRTPDDEMINGEIIVDEPKTRWDYNLPMAIQVMIRSIGIYAHNRY